MKSGDGTNVSNSQYFSTARSSGAWRGEKGEASPGLLPDVFPWQAELRETSSYWPVVTGERF